MEPEKPDSKGSPVRAENGGKGKPEVGTDDGSENQMKRYFLIFFTYAGIKNRQQHQGSVSSHISVENDVYIQAKWLQSYMVRAVGELEITEANVALTNIIELTKEEMDCWNS